jgi:hypothetical protein
MLKLKLTLEAGIVVDATRHADGLLSSEDGLLAAGAGVRHVLLFWAEENGGGCFPCPTRIAALPDWSGVVGLIDYPLGGSSFDGPDLLGFPDLGIIAKWDARLNGLRPCAPRFLYSARYGLNTNVSI